MSRVVLAAAAIGLMTTGCGGAGQPQAKDTVCGARARIAGMVQELAAIADPVAATRQVQGDLIAIGANLKQITDAEPRLDSAQRQQVTTAVEAFRSEATAVTGALLLGERLSVIASRAKVRAALDGLASKYQRTLAAIDCR